MATACATCAAVPDRRCSCCMDCSATHSPGDSRCPRWPTSATVYAVDMPGAGFSDRPPNAPGSFRAHAERLLRFLDGVGVESCDLLGTSHGGAVAMMAAALAPERVRSLILVAPVNPWSAHGRRLAPFLSSAPVSWLLLRFEPMLGIAHDGLLRRLYGDPQRITSGYARRLLGTLQNSRYSELRTGRGEVMEPRPRRTGVTVAAYRRHSGFAALGQRGFCREP